MPKFSANLTMLFNEVDFLSRFEKAAGAGFKGVEFLFPYRWDKEVLAELLTKFGLEQVLHNLPAGDWEAGERGIACLPDRVDEFQEGVGLAIEYAEALKCPRLNCLVGNTPEGVSADRIQKTMVDNLRLAAAALEKKGIRLLVEHLNHHDNPGFHLMHLSDVVQLCEEVNHPNLWLQCDIYHLQIMDGDLARTIKENLPRIAHFQLADNPGRHEPGTGEINYPYLFDIIDRAGYDGWIGCEYIPSGLTEENLRWIKPYLQGG